MRPLGHAARAGPRAPEQAVSPEGGAAGRGRDRASAGGCHALRARARLTGRAAGATAAAWGAPAVSPLRTPDPGPPAIATTAEPPSSTTTPGDDQDLLPRPDCPRSDFAVVPKRSLAGRAGTVAVSIWRRRGSGHVSRGRHRGAHAGLGVMGAPLAAPSMVSIASRNATASSKRRSRFFSSPRSTILTIVGEIPRLGRSAAGRGGGAPRGGGGKKKSTRPQERDVARRQDNNITTAAEYRLWRAHPAARRAPVRRHVSGVPHNHTLQVSMADPSPGSAGFLGDAEVRP